MTMVKTVEVKNLKAKIHVSSQENGYYTVEGFLPDQTSEKYERVRESHLLSRVTDVTALVEERLSAMAHANEHIVKALEKLGFK